MQSSSIVLNDVTWQLCGQLSDDDPMRRIAIDRNPFSVGRRADQMLTIPSPTVSGRHAELMAGDGLWVRDLNSTNGTFLNGVRVRDACQVNHGDLIQFAQIVFRVGCDEAAPQSQTVQDESGDRALALIQFDKLMTERAVAPHFQPIVTMDGTPIGYEILGRSRLFGLRDPQTMFMAAAVLNLESELSRIMRSEGIAVGNDLSRDLVLFANTHPSEINEPDVLEFSLRELREMAPTRPMVLEIHEGTATQTEQMRNLRAALNELSIGLAYDDFGAGQARLVELVEVPPDYLKFDMKLVQGLGTASLERQKMVERLVQMTRDLGIVALAEGIEEQADHEVCEQMGFVCAQGYLYGRPAPRAKVPELAAH
ncbi:MAG: EAL domain-containing protein [Planctomycetota bacterium]